MSDQLIVSLGKTGDLLTLLPLFRHRAKDGPIPVMVSKQYAGVFDGVSYVTPVVTEHGPMELDLAFAEAQKLSLNVVVAQVCGQKQHMMDYVLTRREKTKNGKFRGNSFQDSLWDCLDAWPEFYKGHPLIFDKRSPEREKALKEKWLTEGEILKKRNCPKLILVSTGRQPGKKPLPTDFKYKELLMLVLRLAFKKAAGGGYRIIDLDEVVAERIYDLLALYEEAHCLVATDNAPLHLGQAMPTLPICALCSDRPGNWNGSSWRANHLFYSRYSDFPERVGQLVKAITGINSVSSFPWQRKIDGPKNLHVWSEYEINEDNWQRHVAASQTWQQRYQQDGNWVSCKIEKGAIGRDTQSAGMKDSGRYPFLKDVLRMAAQRATKKDSVIITRCDTCLAMTSNLTNGFGNRELRIDKTTSYSPYVDLIAFPQSTIERMGELPDMVMGPDMYWAEVLRAWAGVPELENAVWREQ